MQDSLITDPNRLLVDEILKEKRSERRWKNFRFIVWFCLFTFIAFSVFGVFRGGASSTATSSASGKYVALIRLEGMIAPGRGFSAEEVVPMIKEALEDKRATGLILDIDSPGGTPVQAAIIHDAILMLKKKNHKKVVIVGEDMLTSGAYYVAVAGDKIYVNPNTITGSVGVIMKGFGFVDAMKKIGVERRVYIAGSEKDRLDPFLPQTPEDMKKIKEVMGEVHQNFVNAVMAGRKGKLTADAQTLFNGDFWSGTSAFKLGLVDGLGNLMDVMNTEFNTSEFKEYGDSNSILKMITGQLSSSLDMMFYTMG